MKHMFLRILSLGAENKVRDFVLEEESVTIPESIHTIAFDKANSKPLQDIVIEFPTQDNLVVHEEQTQDP